MTTASWPVAPFTCNDLQRAYKAWGCNCGPSALAATLDMTLEEIRPHLGEFERKGYMNPSMMGKALESLGVRWSTAYRPRRHPDPSCRFPARGLVRIQWGGPWLNPGVPVGAAYQRTHWFSSRDHAGEPWIFDVNSGWILREVWERKLVPYLIATIKNADGTWLPTHRWEVLER